MENLNNYNIQKRAVDSIAKTQQIPYSPVAFEKGEGAILFDFDGKRYIDFLSSACSANLGHGNKEIAQAVKAQMDKLTQYTFAYFNTAPPMQLAEKLCSIAPGNSPKKALFSCTGSAAMDSAIKVARAYTGRNKLISMEGAYHGSTYGALSVSALSLNMRRHIGPLIPEVYHFHYPTDEYNWEKCIEEIEHAFSYYLPPDEVAAIIIEPIAADMGLIIPPEEWIQSLRKLCDKYKILLISDEIQLALCRTGKWFATENFGIEADLYVMGKALGGGLPLGALIGKKELLDCLEPPAHTFTLSGNTTVCVAALKNIEIMERIDANKLSIEKGNYLKDKFLKLKKKYDFIGDIRGFGLSLGVDIINPSTGKKDPKATSKICYECFKRGLILIFLNKSTLRIQPPLVIEYAEIDEAMDLLENVMQDYSNGAINDSVLNEIKGW